MTRGFTKLLAVVVTTAGLSALLALSVSADPYHVRGKLAEVDGGALAIDTDIGGRKSVTLAEDAGVFIVDAASLEDIKEGQFIGITSIMSQGQRVALEVHIFSEDLRGLAEGHYPWDLVEEDNMMTNANVSRLLAVGADRQLTVSYGDVDVVDPNISSGTIDVFSTNTQMNAIVPSDPGSLHGRIVSRCARPR